jgi:hypothetical protein
LFAEVAAAGAALLMVSHEEELGSLFDRVLRLDRRRRRTEDRGMIVHPVSSLRDWLCNRCATAR